MHISAATIWVPTSTICLPLQFSIFFQAYRIEPLVFNSCEPACDIPHFTASSNIAAKAAASLLGSFRKWKSRATTALAEPSSPSAPTNSDHGRLDFVLSPSNFSLADYLTAISAHNCYWTDLDTVFFVVTHAMDIQ